MGLGSFIQEAKRWADQHYQAAKDYAEKNYATEDERNGYVQGHSDGFMCIVPPRSDFDPAAYDKGYRDGQKASG